MILDSQSPEDAIAVDIFPALIQQTPTKIFLPNPDGEYEGSYQRCGLSRKEFNELITKPKESRIFLIKQSKQSVFCTMDLHDFDNEMTVLSGTSENVSILHQIMDECGSDDPDVWLEPFYQAVRQRSGKFQ